MARTGSSQSTSPRYRAPRVEPSGPPPLDSNDRRRGRHGGRGRYGSELARGCGGSAPAQRSVVFSERGNGRGWARTSSLLCVRQALSRLSYSPVEVDREGVEPSNHRLLFAAATTTARLLCRALSYPAHADQFRDKGSRVVRAQSLSRGRRDASEGAAFVRQPRSPRSERGVLPLRRSGTGGHPPRRAPARSVEEGNVTHRPSVLLGVHQHAMPTVQHDRVVVRMANRTLRVQLRVANHGCRV